MTGLLMLLALALIAGLLWSIQYWKISKDPAFGADATHLLVGGLVRGIADVAVDLPGELDIDASGSPAAVPDVPDVPDVEAA